MSQYGDDWEDWAECLNKQFERDDYDYGTEYQTETDIDSATDINREYISWTPTFTYPRTFNNYDAWMAECYAKNQDGTFDFTKGVMARVAEKEGLKVLRDRYKFSNVIDTNLQIAVERMLAFDKHLLPYDLEAYYQSDYFQFDVKARILPQDSNFFLNLSKIEKEEFFLFVRMSGTRTAPISRVVGFLTPNMVLDYFGHLTYEVASFPGYFLFNNTLDAFRAYQEKRNPTDVPLRMQWVEKNLERNPDYTVPSDLMYLVNQYQDFSNNPDIDLWKDKVSRRNL